MRFVMLADGDWVRTDEVAAIKATPVFQGHQIEVVLRSGHVLLEPAVVAFNSGTKVRARAADLTKQIALEAQ